MIDVDIVMADHITEDQKPPIEIQGNEPVSRETRDVLPVDSKNIDAPANEISVTRLNIMCIG